jgi:glycosyltransferase involved in cell wall biosynthesis
VKCSEIVSPVHSRALRHNGLNPAQAPLVSLIVPAYNAERFIENTIHSLLSQTYGAIEVIVIDDGSTDRTAALVRSIQDKDPRVVLIRQANLGVAVARNTGVAQARGEFIAPVDADDLWYPRAVEKLAACLGEQAGGVGIVYAWSVYIDDQYRLTGGFRAANIEGDVFATLLCHNFLGNASCTMIRRECFDFTGGYDSEFRKHAEQGCEDWDFYLRVAEHYNYRVVPEFLVGYRKVAGRMSSDTERMARSHGYMLERVYMRHPRLPRYLSRVSKSSFYIYLAHEGGPASRRAWLRLAFACAPLMCLLRPRFYKLWLSCPDARLDCSKAPRVQGNGPSLETIWHRTWQLHAILIAQRVFHSLLHLYGGRRLSKSGLTAGGLASGASDR